MVVQILAYIHKTLSRYSSVFLSVTIINNVYNTYISLLWTWLIFNTNVQIFAGSVLSLCLRYAQMYKVLCTQIICLFTFCICMLDTEPQTPGSSIKHQAKHFLYKAHK